MSSSRVSASKAVLAAVSMATFAVADMLPKVTKYNCGQFTTTNLGDIFNGDDATDMNTASGVLSSSIFPVNWGIASDKCSLQQCGPVEHAGIYVCYDGPENSVRPNISQKQVGKIAQNLMGYCTAGLNSGDDRYHNPAVSGQAFFDAGNGASWNVIVAFCDTTNAYNYLPSDYPLEFGYGRPFDICDSDANGGPNQCPAPPSTFYSGVNKGNYWS